jgi:flagellar protein FliO/FliZ
MIDLLTWLLVLLFVGGAAVYGFLYLRGELPQGGSSMFFKSKDEPRIEVVEHTSLDSKRRLVLIRRDDVEHLIMTGGPVDVVIETGIGAEPAARSSSVSEPVFQSGAAQRTSNRRFGERAPAADRLQPVSLSSLRRAQNPDVPPDLEGSETQEPPALK